METKIITYGTAGYSDLLKNFYKNLDSLGLSDRLKIFCLDDEEFEYICQKSNSNQVDKRITKNNGGIRQIQLPSNHGRQA